MRLGEIHVPNIGAVQSFETRIGEMDLPVADAATRQRVSVGNVVGLVPQKASLCERGSAQNVVLDFAFRASVRNGTVGKPT